MFQMNAKRGTAMIDNFYMPTRVICGSGALKENSALLKSLGSRCLIVTGGSGAKLSGALDDAKNALSQQGVKFEIFDKIGANPLISACHKAGEEARKVKADFIFGIGGGSALDAAKAVAIYAANPSLTPAEIYNRVYDNPPLPVALCGTTAGTGSEVTGVSVLTDDETGKKKSMSGADLYAALSFCDAGYTVSSPYSVTVSTALDALAHAVEGYFIEKCRGPLDLFAEKSIRDVYICLDIINKTHALPDLEARDKLYYGSIYAGLVLNTCGTAFPHPMGYVLTEHFGIPHGFACTAFMPAFLERCARFSPERSKAFEALLPTDIGSFIATVKALTDLSGVSITKEQAEEFSQRWAGAIPKNFAASPGGLSQEEAAGILAALR